MITNSRVKSAHPFSPSSSIAGFKGGRKRDTVRYISWNHSLIFESWQSFPRSNHLTFEFYIGKHKTDLLLMSTYKMHNMQVASLSFIWDKMRTAARETALRNCSQEAGRKVSVYELLVTGEYMKPATYSSRRFLLVSWSCCWSWGTVISMKDFSNCRDMGRYKNWAHKISSWEYLTIWRPVLPVFPPAQGASLMLSTLNSFRGCWRSAAALAHDLILVEVDGEHPGQVPICTWHSLEKQLDSLSQNLTGKEKT